MLGEQRKDLTEFTVINIDHGPIFIKLTMPFNKEKTLDK